MTADLADSASGRTFEAGGPRWRELRDERVITNAWCRPDGRRLYLIVEAGDGVEAQESMTRLPWVMDGTVTLSMVAVDQV
ncbi:hypothetical protein BJ973_000344 [Actinoplanes tereljensis]|uniref:hypothetical protein n=1 Tax=Paractinoplanes tereljensis TaxID=571912 RepID=UPI001943F912|nr:hypothetical protein [Actinoplanes tereljensis]